MASKDSSEEIDKARQALRAAEKTDRELMEEKASHALKAQLLMDQARGATIQLNQANQMLEAMRWMQESIEQSIEQPETAVADAVSRTLEAGEPWLKLSLNFETRQHYTIDIYEARKSDGTTRLHLVAHIRSTKCDIARARSWEIGEGVGGHCLARNIGVIISDAAEAQVQSIVSNSPNDAVTYRSFAAFPIRAGKPEDVWGVVIATNSDPGFFEAPETDSRGATSPAGRIKLLAGLMGLVVQVHGSRGPADLRNDAEKPVVDDTPH